MLVPTNYIYIEKEKVKYEFYKVLENDLWVNQYFLLTRSLGPTVIHY